MSSTFSATNFVAVTDEMLEVALGQEFTPVSEDEETNRWLFKYRYTCMLFVGEDVRLEIRRAFTQVTDGNWLHANYQTVGLVFTGPMGPGVARLVSGGAPITEPVLLRARPAPEQTHEGNSFLGRVSAVMFRLGRTG